MSVTFIATDPFGDPSLDRFVWKGNHQFFLPNGPDDQLSIVLEPDYQNETVEIFWRHFDAPPVNGVAGLVDSMIWLNFSRDGSWSEEIKVLDGAPPSDIRLAWAPPHHPHHHGDLWHI